MTTTRASRSDARALEDALLKMGASVHDHSKPELGRLLGVHGDTIRRALKRLGIAHRTSETGSDRTATEQAIRELGERIYELTKAEIAEEIGRSEQTVHEAMTRLGIVHDGQAIASAKRPIRHGTPSAWQELKCRCQVCTDARREYKRAERARALESFDPAEHEHGLTGTYQRGCDCDECAEATRQYLARRNERSRETAHAHGGRWSGREIRYALREDLTMEQISRDLGRTYSAISNVRTAVAAGHPRYMALLHSEES